MKGYASLLLSAGLLIAAKGMIAGSSSENSSVLYIGTVHDRADDQKSSATQCPVIKGPRYILQTETAAWALHDERKVAKFSGKRVSIRGKIIDGNQLTITEIAPVK